MFLQGEAGATWHMFTHRKKEQGTPSKIARFGHVEHVGRERERISSDPIVAIFCNRDDDPAVRSKGVFDEKKRRHLSRVLPFCGFQINWDSDLLESTSKHLVPLK